MSNAKRMRKTDGLWLQQDNEICNVRVVAADSATVQPSPAEGITVCDFACLAGVAGKLLCVNKRLIAEPDLLWRRPHDAGYLAVLALNRKQHADAIAQLADLDTFAQQRNVPPELLRSCGVFGAADYERVQRARVGCTDHVGEPVSEPG